MYDSHEPPYDPSEEESFASRWLSRRRAHSSGDGPARWVGLAVLLIAVGGLGWWWWSQRGPAVDPFPQAIASPAGSMVEPDTVTPLDLPPLEESDSFVRGVVEALSSHPEWTRWLITDRLVERFVVSTVNVAAGGSPAEHVPFMEPDGEFEVQGDETGGGAGEPVLIDPASYRRYDLATAVITSLNTQGSARLYRQMRPLLNEAYAEAGFPDGSFDDVLARAISVVLSVPVPSEPVLVVKDVTNYEFADPELEALTRAEKHMLRMGPENMRRIQAKLRELSNAIGLQLSPAAG